MFRRERLNDAVHSRGKESKGRARTSTTTTPNGHRARRPPRHRRPAVQRPVPPQAPGQGRRLARGGRARRRRPEPARRRRHRLADGSLGPDPGRPDRLHRRGARLPDRPDAVCRALLLRDPAGGLSGPGRVLADRDRLRGGRGDEQLPAREHRHVRDPAHVRRDHPRRDVRRVDRRLPGAEDLLHGRRHLRLPVPLPLGAGLVRREPRQPLRAPGRARS